MRAGRALTLVGALLLASCTSTRTLRPEPWLELERRQPRIDAPHLLRYGEKEDALRVQMQGGWNELVRTEGTLDVTMLASHAALIRQLGFDWVAVVRPDAPKPVSLPAASCLFADVSPDGREIVCAACADPGPGFERCMRLEVLTYDTRGTEMSHLERELRADERCHLGPLMHVLFTSELKSVLAVECRRECRLVSLPDWEPIAEVPGLCKFDDAQLSRMRLHRGRAPVAF
jgi:hypothetical protein